MNMATKPVSQETSERALAAIEDLVGYALRQRMIAPLDVEDARNALLDLFGFTEPGEGPDEAEGAAPSEPAELLEPLLDYGYAAGLIPDNTTTWRDLLDARIMGLLLPRPSAVADAFERRAEREGIAAATDAFYKLNIDANYIRMDRVRKNEYWLQSTAYGPLEMTINLSKPEKDPKEIALLKTLPPSRYPKCLLCKENVGYAGRPDHPARQNLRVLPLKLDGEDWFFQYSPYVYYNEHSIVFNARHVPMVISDGTFKRLLDFVDRMPHYFIGSNADLPIVGGSILNHDHFQAGRHVFPMEKAEAEASFTHPSYPGTVFGIVNWPMSVLRLQSASRDELLGAASMILAAWRSYSDASVDIEAYTEQPGGERIPHNTITPIARRKADGRYELDLVLRNNRTSGEHPDGIFHPHRHLHHIKKENIGLIEVMGLAVLPGRLKAELAQLARYLTGETPYDAAVLADAGHPLHSHADWLAGLVQSYGTALASDEAHALLREETGRKFTEVLHDAGVFKRNDAGRAAFAAFAASVGLQPN